MEGLVTTLEERLQANVGARNLLDAELVAIIADLAETGAWGQYGGIRSLSHFLCWQTGCSPATAHRLIALAEARATHPKVSALFADGQLSVDQAAAAVKARPACDEVMSHLAPLSTVTQIQLEVRAANSNPYPGPPEEAALPDVVVPDEVVAHGWSEHNQWWLSAALDPDRGAVVQSALDEARDRLFAAGRTDVTWADALVDIAARSLAAVPVERQRLFRINVFLDSTGHGSLIDGTVLPDAITRHLTCDGHLSPILTDGALPVSVGRTQRIVPERTRRVVMHRDGGRCVNPACRSRHGLEIHHLRHWLDGGPTDTANLVTLCAGCHRLHHRGRLEIDGNPDHPDGLSFSDHHGRRLQRPTPIPPAGAPPGPAVPYRHPLGDRLDPGALAGIFPEPPHPN